MLRDPGPTLGEMEVLLLQRNARSAFLPGAHVFPGGAVEEADFAPAMAGLCRGMGFDLARRIIGDTSPPERSLGFFVAAIREAFEESGILLAGNVTRQHCLDEKPIALWSEGRAEVNADPSLFAARLRDRGLELATDRLLYFAHWITPDALPIRFDARFFVAAVPSGQDASPDGEETVSARWISPREALVEHRQGRIMLAPPTFHSLGELAVFRSAEEVISATRGRRVETRYG